MPIRIGNQTAISAGSVELPFVFAVEQGFDAFEWFPDRNESGAGWTEDDFDREQRAHLKETALSHDIHLSVHAPWWASPLNPDALQVLSKSIDFAEDIGASLFNLHLHYERGASSYLQAVAPLFERLAAAGIRLSLENTPLTGPNDFNELFSEFDKCGWDQPELLGMCFDLGHANLCRATRNDYLRFMDLLDSHVPIIHLHLHENYGDHDRHLALFTGPAGRDPSGIEGLLERLAKRDFAGCIILEQWPQPPTLLLDARNRLLEMIGKVCDSHRRNCLESRDTLLPSLDNAGDLSASIPPLRGARGVSYKWWQAFTPPFIPPQGGNPQAPPPKSTALTSPIKGEELDVSALEKDEEADCSSSRNSQDQGFLRTLVEADRQNRSWREKLSWIRDVLSGPEIVSSPERLVFLAIYLRFIGTGQVLCHEDGRHFRPSHHAVMARDITDRLAAIANARTAHIIRRITPWLPSSGSEFTRSEPLTLIRDIAHRNDIPQELKTEIKHTLQNKLHRCAGPEDLVTSAALLARVTAPETAYAPAFVAQFKHFHEQLKEFFSAGSLDEQLQGMVGDEHDPDAALIKTFLDAKAGATTLPQLLRVFEVLSVLRERFAEKLPETSGSHRQQLQLADIKLEEFAFVLLSQLVNYFERRRIFQANSEEPITPLTIMECVRLTVGNLRCSGFDRDECRAVEAELETWRQYFEPRDYQQVLRLKATLERARRLADDYRDTVLRVFPQKVAELGHALGVSEPSIRVYTESEIRSHLVFQLSRILALFLKAAREHAALSRWEVIVPGEATGRLLASPSLENLPRLTEPAIALIDRLQGDEKIPNGVSGIIVSHETPYLSHFAVRAREAGVVFVACEDTEQASTLMPFVGHSAVLKASPGEVGVTLASNSNPLPDKSLRRHLRPPQSEMPKVELSSETCLLPLESVSVANGGQKAYGARLLEELSRQGGAGFETPRGLVIPFGVMETLLHAQPSLEMEYHRSIGCLDHLPSGELREKSERLQSLIREIEMPPALASEGMRQFGPNVRLMVRSSASCEDLAGLTAAGLYESVANVEPGRLADAVREVWASLWSPHAVLNRKSSGFSHDRTFMAVLIQQLISPDLSFIMHTRNPLSENPDEMLVELVVGLGQTLASAEQPGTPYRLVCNKVTGVIRMLAFANFSEAVFPDAEEGVATKKLDYSKIEFSTNASCRESIGNRLGSIGGLVEAAFGGPQDIEGVLAGEIITLVQSRPQQLHLGSGLVM